MELKPHFMIGATDGHLYDCRAPGWSRKPLRPDFAKHFQKIETAAQFKATIRAGGYAWPGGYAIALYCSDGGALCFDCGRKEARAILDSIKTDCRDGWHVVGCGIEYDGEGAGVNCDHCGAVISAPAEEETDQ